MPLHEGLYAEAGQRGLTLTGYLETFDPSPENAQLDAFERQLAVAGLRINGDGADIIDRFFASKENAVLFPEYVSRSVQVGVQDFTKLPKILAGRVKIGDNTYKSLYMDDSVYGEGEKSLARTAEGAELPRVDIKTEEREILIQKYGRYLQVTYEAIRRKRANVVSTFLRAVGVQLQRDKFADAVNVLVNGDGNNNAASVINATTSGTLAFGDMAGFVLAFDPYELNVMLANSNTAAKLFNLNEVKEHVASNGLRMEGGGSKLFGAELVVDSAVPAGYLIGLDRRFALQEVYETPVTAESERLIRRQVEGTAISQVAGFARLIKGAVKILNIDW